MGYSLIVNRLNGIARMISENPRKSFPLWVFELDNCCRDLAGAFKIRSISLGHPGKINMDMPQLEHLKTAYSKLSRLCAVGGLSFSVEVVWQTIISAVEDLKKQEYLDLEVSSGRQAVIVVCEAMAGEMRVVAEEKSNPFVMQVISSQCHREPAALKQKIDQLVDSFGDQPMIFLAYGNCSGHGAGDHPRVYKLRVSNCASALLGGDSRFQELAQGSYFLTPYLALNWKQYFLGRVQPSIDRKTASYLEKWFSPMERLIRINLCREAGAEDASAAELAKVIKKPLIAVQGTLELLRNEYDSFVSGFLKGAND